MTFFAAKTAAPAWYCCWSHLAARISILRQPSRISRDSLGQRGHRLLLPANPGDIIWFFICIWRGAVMVSLRTERNESQMWREGPEGWRVERGKWFAHEICGPKADGLRTGLKWVYAGSIWTAWEYYLKREWPIWEICEWNECFEITCRSVI